MFRAVGTGEGDVTSNDDITPKKSCGSVSSINSFNMLTVDCSAGAVRVILEARNGMIPERLCYSDDAIFLLTLEKTAKTAWV
jgi:hypothetical protein